MGSYREKEEPKRIDYAITELTEAGFDVHYQDKTKIKFYHNGNEITLFPFTGWHTGKSIKDGRGLNKLLKQIKWMK